MNGAVCALLTLGKDGEDAGEQRKGGQQAGQLRADDRRDAGDEQDETGADQDPCGDIPPAESGGANFVRFLFGHEQRSCQNGEQYQNKKQRQWQGQILQGGREDGENGQASERGDAPIELCGQPGMDKAKSDQRKTTTQCATDGVGGEGNIVADGEEEDHRAGGQGQANDPATDGRPPAATGQAGRADDDRREDQFESENVHEDLPSQSINDQQDRKVRGHVPKYWRK